MAKPVQLGMGVMIQMLGGNKETVDAFQASVGETIESVVLEDDTIKVALRNGKVLVVTDTGQSCCERRWIDTDADLPSYSGKAIRGFRRSEYQNKEEAECDVHDFQSFLIDTTEGTIDFVTHVDHNGYYGGFSITASLR